MSVDQHLGSHVFAVLAPVLGLMAVSNVSTESLQKVWEGPCWERMWPFLDPWDVVGMRTTASSWNIQKKCRPPGELFFFLIKKEPVLREMVDFGHSTPLEAEESCAIWASRMMGAMSSGTSADDEECEEHNVENLALEVVGQGWSGGVVYLFHEDWELACLALICRLALDLLCQDMLVVVVLLPLLQCFESLSHHGRAATVWSGM